ncbi:MAG: transcription termination factor Rho [Puniceicoccales bacterium]|jgi:transcription termination factor Rho|nr:transcription termination factor Rho [Puniceicoccales bacterium]
MSESQENPRSAPAQKTQSGPVVKPQQPASVTVEGILEIDARNCGALVAPVRAGKTRPTDPFVSQDLIKRYKLKRGSYITGQALHDTRFPNPKLRTVETVDGLDPEVRARRFAFQQLTSIAPDKQLRLETQDERLTNRVIDLFCPIGKGTRGVIVAPPRTGKTTLLKDIAKGVFENHPECKVMVLLVDERPEEVTDFRRDLPNAELYASSNDEDVQNHIRVAEACIERARRLVEAGAETVLLIDSLTRLTRAYNNAKTGSGKTMSGGIDSRALEKPRQIFSSARNTEEGGSLTIVASALVQTGSRMDDLIFEEFKGTGNMEMVLDRKVAELRIWPAFNLAASGTRKEELILAADALEAASFLRRAMVGGKIEDIAEAMIERLGKTKNNAEFIRLIRS